MDDFGIRCPAGHAGPFLYVQELAPRLEGEIRHVEDGTVWVRMDAVDVNTDYLECRAKVDGKPCGKQVEQEFEFEEV